MGLYDLLSLGSLLGFGSGTIVAFFQIEGMLADWTDRLKI